MIKKIFLGGKATSSATSTFFSCIVAEGEFFFRRATFVLSYVVLFFPKFCSVFFDMCCHLMLQQEVDGCFSFFCLVLSG